MCKTSEQFRASTISYDFHGGEVLKGEFKPCHFAARIDEEEQPLIRGSSFEAVRLAAIARILREAGQ